MNSKPFSKKVEFSRWLLTPSHQRNPSTQLELAKQLGVSFVTLSRWKYDDKLQGKIIPDIMCDDPDLVSDWFSRLLQPGNMQDRLFYMRTIFQYFMKMSAEEKAELREFDTGRYIVTRRGRRGRPPKGR